ncbi:MAG: aldehyde ferredoxin oxidoreductase family protein [Candidatus Lokiarchaeota archaeon]|nr:aldehyde ferredoxin oxidoreductase family protein [Candidatus Lokiarchaeota archaeon]
MTETKGYNGKVAFVDLSAGTTTAKNLDPVVAGKYIGGAGLAAKLVWDVLRDEDYEALKKDPLSGVNPLVFATGPLTGSPAPSSSRYAVCGISPLTGIWGEATSGGYLPAVMKRCGFDAIVVTGKAIRPVFLLAADGKVEIKEAAGIWGKDTCETIGAVKKELADEAIRVACIGKAGEHLVKYAAVINDEGRAAGRCGMGTLMGSKNMKALAVKGGQKIEYADREALANVAKESLKNIHGNFSIQFMRHYGTALYTDMGMILGDVPARYFTASEFVAEGLTGRALKEQYPVENYGCAGCTIQCGRTTRATIGKTETVVDGPEYETIAAYGPLCGILDLAPIVEANHVANLEGIDTISSGVCIAFLLYLVDQKLGLDRIKPLLKGMDLTELRWGNSKAVLALLRQTIERQGIGNLLAEGTRAMAKELGVDPGLAAHVKGLEIPMHDPRAYAGQALTYMVSCCGANHNKADFFNLDGDAATLMKVKKGDRFNIAGREDSVANAQDIANVYDSAAICNFPHLNVIPIARMLKAATGIAILGTAAGLLKAGERGTTVKRLISCKLGVTSKDDALPPIVTRVLTTGGTAGRKLDLDRSLAAYYENRGWDSNGVPTLAKLQELDL